MDLVGHDMIANFDGFSVGDMETTKSFQQGLGRLACLPDGSQDPWGCGRPGFGPQRQWRQRLS